jgi:hypothetical protein
MLPFNEYRQAVLAMLALETRLLQRATSKLTEILLLVPTPIRAMLLFDRIGSGKFSSTCSTSVAPTNVFRTAPGKVKPSVFRDGLLLLVQL